MGIKGDAIDDGAAYDWRINFPNKDSMALGCTSTGLQLGSSELYLAD